MKTKSHLPLLLILCFLLLGLSGLNLYWLKLDTRPHAYTDGYPEKTMNLADGLRDQGIQTWPRHLYWATIGPRPSLYQAMASPFVLFVERSPDGMLIVNTLFMIVLGLAVYQLGALAAGPLAGFLAALIVSTYPLTLQLGMHARPHALLPATTALVILSMVLAIRRRTWPMAWLVAACLFLTFSIHASGIILLGALVAVFCLYTAFFQTEPKRPASWDSAWSWVLSKLRDPFVLHGLIPAMGSLLTVVALWMVLKWEQWLALKEVSERIFLPMYGFWDYEQTLPRQVSWIFTGLLLLGIVVSTLRVMAAPQRNGLRGFLLLALFSLFAMAHLSGAVGWAAFAGVLPLLALVTAVGVLDLLAWVWAVSSNRRLHRTIATALLGLTATGILVNYAHARWGLLSSLPLLGDDHFERCTQDDWVCPRYPMGGDWQLQPLLGVMVRDNACRQQGCRLVHLSKRPAWFSEEPLTYGLVQYYPQASLLPSDAFYPQRTVRVDTLGTGAGGVLNWLIADYVVFLSDGQGQPSIDDGPYWGNKAVERALVTWLARDMNDNPSSAYREVFKAALPSGAFVTLARRERDIGAQEARDIVSSLQLPEETRQGFYPDLEQLTADDLAADQAPVGEERR